MLQWNFFNNLGAHFNQTHIAIKSIIFPENLTFALQTIELFEAYRAEQIGDSQTFIAQGFQFGLLYRIKCHTGHSLIL